MTCTSCKTSYNALSHNHCKLGTLVVTLRHPSKRGPVGTSSDDGIRRDPSRLRVVGLKLALCELVG